MNNLPLVNIHNRGKRVFLFLRGEDKKLRIETVNDFYPYFYEPDSQGKYISYDGKRLTKILCKIPSEVKMRRSPNSYESDILFFKRFMIDKIDGLDKCPIKWCFEDTEILSPELPKPENPIYPISCISVYNNFDGEIKTWFLLDYEGTMLQKEKQLLQDFINYMLTESFDIWLSYNVDFDYGYIHNRYQKIFHRHFAELISPISQSRYGRDVFYPAGISIIDYLTWFKKINKGFKSYALDYVSQQEFNEASYKKIPFDVLSLAIKLKNINDIKRMVKLENKHRLIDSYYDELRRHNKVVWENLDWNSYIIEARTFDIAKRKKIMLPNRPKKSKEKEKKEFEGADREAFEKGRFWNGGKYDLSGAYLFAIIDLCLDSTNIEEKSEDTIPVSIRDKKTKKIIETYNIKQNPNALLPSLAKELLEEKAYLKNLKKNTNPQSPEYKDIERKYEAGIKPVVLSAWGVMGYKGYRLYDKRIAGMITSTVRDLINYANDKLKEQGYRVLYFDTDGTIVDDKGKNLTDLLNSIVQQWSKERFNKESSITFEYEGRFEKLFIIGRCHYKGWIQTAKGLKEEIKGIEVKRVSSTDYEAKFQDELLERAMNKQTREEVLEWIKAKIKTLPEKPLKQIAMPAKSKAIEEYKTHLVRKSKDKETGEIVEKKFDKKLPIFIRALQNSPLKKRVGELFWWVYVKGEKQIMAFDETHKDHIKEIDWQKMIDRNILNKVKPIFEALKWDLGDLVPEKPKKRAKTLKNAQNPLQNSPEQTNEDKVGKDTSEIEWKKDKLTKDVENKEVKEIKAYYEE